MAAMGSVPCFSFLQVEVAWETIGQASTTPLFSTEVSSF
ncbi:hypothetical protein COLO4_29081 [Corchorus olitorius]|uniref:Uncharacterized protein n=1 Tax=Corchorus olitorius TaxID=93759 RepID=A0A1R3HGG4_9ROSI|nr:hypothetical protein COLO4_29081 [Corchorus olitorius]